MKSGGPKFIILTVLLIGAAAGLGWVIFDHFQNLAGLSKSAPGPAASRTPEQQRIDQLEKENDRLNRKLEIANDCLDLQKKALSMLDRMSNGKDA